jgi:hypothetical protein
MIPQHARPPAGVARTSRCSFVEAQGHARKAGLPSLIALSVGVMGAALIVVGAVRTDSQRRLSTLLIVAGLVLVVVTGARIRVAHRTARRLGHRAD